jgi:putative ABC transport system ATP-binding protein
MANTIEAEHLTKAYGEGPNVCYALRDVSLGLERGRITALLGPSGSGKSTLLAVLSGLLHPDRGTVRLLDEDVGNMTDQQRESFRRRHCGFIFQHYNLFPALTACQQLEIALAWASELPRGGAGQRAKDILIALGLGDKLQLRPLQLSGGEKQRVAVARALVKRPALLFADEPTAALDWEHGAQVIRLLQAAACEDDATVLLVSHDPRIVPLVDRVLQLRDGQLTDTGERPDRGISNPRGVPE